MMQTKVCRLVLLDHRAMFRQALRALLERYQDLVVVGEAQDNLSALAQARELGAVVVVIGAEIPGPDVFQTTAAIRRELPRTEVIILAAGSDDPGSVYRAIKAGARGYVSQEDDVEGLVRAIRLVAQGQAMLATRSLTSLVDLIMQPRGPVEDDRVVDQLTPREQEVLDLLAGGISNREIAERLCLSESTVRSHIHHILEKLHLTNRVQAATFALSRRQIAGARLSPRLTDGHHNGHRVAVTSGKP